MRKRELTHSENVARCTLCALQAPRFPPPPSEQMNDEANPIYLYCTMDGICTECFKKTSVHKWGMLDVGSGSLMIQRLQMSLNKIIKRARQV